MNDNLIYLLVGLIYGFMIVIATCQLKIAFG